jgi:hypothetical protein
VGCGVGERDAASDIGKKAGVIGYWRGTEVGTGEGN